MYLIQVYVHILICMMHIVTVYIGIIHLVHTEYLPKNNISYPFLTPIFKSISSQCSISIPLKGGVKIMHWLEMVKVSTIPQSVTLRFLIKSASLLYRKRLF